MQYKVDIKNMRLVEVVSKQPNIHEYGEMFGGALPSSVIQEAFSHDTEVWENEVAKAKSYPILASDLSYWQPLDGKILGEGEFEVDAIEHTTYSDGEFTIGGSNLYAIPIQPKEQGEEWLKETREKVGNAIMYYSNPQATGIIMSIIENCIRFPPITPATPASSDVWEEAFDNHFGADDGYLLGHIRTSEVVAYIKSLLKSKYDEGYNDGRHEGELSNY